MGNRLIRFYQTRITKEQKRAFAVCFVFCLLVHAYKFTNTLPNHDGMYNIYASQNMVGSGRWFLKYACGISSYYDLPWVNGLLSSLYIALTAGVIVELFRIKNPVLIFVAGGILASSPATTETLFFNFTADGYFLAMLLAALGVYLSRMEEKRIFCWIVSGGCICVCCGIYQAYVSFALVLAVCYFIYELLLDRHDRREYLLWTLRQALIYGISLAAYYVIWKLRLRQMNMSAYSYQGINEVGTISLELIRHGFVSAFDNVEFYLLQFGLDRGFSLYNVLNAALMVVLVLGVVLASVKSRIWRRPVSLVLLALCLFAIVPFAYIWHFTSTSVYYRPLMCQSVMLPFLLTGVLYEQWGRDWMKDLAGLLLVVIVLHNGLIANISYFYMHICNERTMASAAEMAAEIHDLQDEYDFDTIAVIGNTHADSQWPTLDPDTGMLVRPGDLYVLTGQLEQNLLVDYWQITQFLSHYYEITLTPASTEVCNALAETDAVTQMPCWPAEDSMAVIDGMLVLKIAD